MKYDRLRYLCRKLHNITVAEYRKNPELYSLDYIKKAPLTKKQREFTHNLKKKYKLTEEDYNNLLVKQGNVCKICGKAETHTFKGKVINLAVDHCHKTGKVRGLLCYSCNTALGKFEDDVNFLQKAIEYLKNG